jgi:hypothetical protein
MHSAFNMDAVAAMMLSPIDSCTFVSTLRTVVLPVRQLG